MNLRAVRAQSRSLLPELKRLDQLFVKQTELQISTQTRTMFAMLASESMIKFNFTRKM